MKNLSGGYFVLNPGTRNEHRIKNTLVSAGAQAFLQQLFQSTGLPVEIAIGLTGAGYNFSTSLADLVIGEPVGNGYERQIVRRDALTWNVSQVGDAWRAQSAPQQFTATNPWTKTWIRMFLTPVIDGSNNGTLYACSGPMLEQQVVVPGNAPAVSYEFWLRA